MNNADCSSGLKLVTRKIDKNTKLLLFAKAGGRCEFFNCNHNLLKDDITQKDVIWGELAHIYAFSPNGPRASLTIDKRYLNNVENLMLLCPNCHTKIDNKELVAIYTAEILREQKSNHEKRIKLAIGLKEDRKTKVIKMISSIGKEKVSLSRGEMIEALLSEKRYPSESNPLEIDFSDFQAHDDQSYWKSKTMEINEGVGKFLDELKREKTEHISVFALGPIPLLMCLGFALPNKIKTQFFQRHRNNETWKWKTRGKNVKYKLDGIQKGKDAGKVALILSLSGKVHRSSLPKMINGGFYAYEITLSGIDPNYTFLNKKSDLYEFESIYLKTISKIKNCHPGLKEIHLFPAIPAPVAVICGRSLNRNADISMKVYNLTPKNNFKYTLKIN